MTISFQSRSIVRVLCTLLSPLPNHNPNHLYKCYYAHHHHCHIIIVTTIINTSFVPIIFIIITSHLLCRKLKGASGRIPWSEHLALFVPSSEKFRKSV